jgi:adenine-specific DNA-methyltransferase
MTTKSFTNKRASSKKNIPQEVEPELFWLNKKTLETDVCTLYKKEHISPKVLIEKLYRLKEAEFAQLAINYSSGNDGGPSKNLPEYYQHQENWANRFIQGDSLLVMTSLLEREGMAGSVQMIYFDPPYGIDFKGKWHKQTNACSISAHDDNLSDEPDKVKAYRDTWKFGISSYLSFLRERLIKARELLAESGACFVQISDENVHLVRCVMDEVFGRKNYVANIIFKTCSNTRHKRLSIVNDYIIFYAKNIKKLKYHKLYTEKKRDLKRFNLVELDDGTIVNVNQLDRVDESLRPFCSEKLQSSSGAGNTVYPFEYKGKIYKPSPHRGWRCAVEHLKKLAQENRLLVYCNTLRYKYYYDDFRVAEINNLWDEQLSEKNKTYVVQTSVTVLQRCLLMTTDPGDIVLDPTGGSGTTAYVAEQWGRRWITIDTAGIAFNIAKKRLITAVFPYYELYDEKGPDIRQGFIYKTEPHTTMRTVIYDEEPMKEILYDKAKEDKNRFRITGPFTVETLHSHEPLATKEANESEALNDFKQEIFDNLKSAGIKNGIKNEQAVFIRLASLSHSVLHVVGFYNASDGEKKAYFHIGPQFGTVTKQAANAAVKECRRQSDANWLIILGFSFESNLNETVDTSLDHFDVTFVRMNEDLLQPSSLLKEDNKAAPFVIIGEPDIQRRSNFVEICGIKIYNPIKNRFESREIFDIITYWMLDDNYDGSHFIAKQIFCCDGNKKEFHQWRKILSTLQTLCKRTQAPLNIEIDEDAFDRAYGSISHPITIKQAGQKIAVRMFGQFGEENMRILEVF